MQATAAVTATTSELDTLCNHLVVENGLRVLAFPDGEHLRPHGAPTAETWPLIEVPELAELAPHFDRILVDYNGVTIAATCIRDRTLPGSMPIELTREELRDAGSGLLPYCGKINGNQMPAWIQVWEIGSTLGAVEHLQQLHVRYPGRRKVTVAAWSLGLDDQQVWTNVLFGGKLAGRGKLQRILATLAAGEGPPAVVAPRSALGEDEKPWLTWGLAAVLALAFVYQVVAGATEGLLSTTVESLYEMGGLHGPAVRAGEFHRLLSAIFLHGDPLHLLLNGVALVLGGVVLESLLGRAHLVALFVACGLGGSLASLAWNGDMIISVGASGAVVGMLVCGLVVAQRLSAGEEKTQITMQLIIWSVPSLIPLATNRTGDSIDFAAHLGGAAVGAVLGFAMLRMWDRTREAPPFPRTARVASVVLGSAAVLACARAWAM